MNPAMPSSRISHPLARKSLFWKSFATAVRHGLPWQGSAPQGTTSSCHFRPGLSLAVAIGLLPAPSLLNPGDLGARVAARCSHFTGMAGWGCCCCKETCRARQKVVL